MRLQADPSGVAFFGGSLWNVADADLIRYRACVIAANALAAK